MNITIVCDVLGSENNGTTLAAMNLYRYLVSKNHNVKILCADQSKIGKDNYFVVPNLNLGIFNKLVEKNNVTLAKPKKDIVLNAIKDADLVHIMMPLALGKYTAKLAHSMNIPITAGFHAQAENVSCQIKLQDSIIINKLIYKNFYNGLYKYTDAIHYPTLFIKNTFEKEINKKTNGYVISNGVNQYIEKKEIDKPKEIKDKFIILSTGRYSREKAQAVLIKAIYYSKFKDKIQLILAGQGPLKEKYEKLGKNLPNKPILQFFSREEIINVINYADLYVHPAEMELEGIACIEAICCGKTTIVCDSKKSATPNFAIDDKCKFKMRDPKDLAKKIDYFIENNDERKKYEKLYLNSAQNFNQQKCMENMEKMMIEVVKNHKKQSC